jgi:homocysteine S-methyltransferase
VGCYGASLADGSEYVGRYGLTVEQLLDFHRGRMELLVQVRGRLGRYTRGRVVVNT